MARLLAPYGGAQEPAVPGAAVPGAAVPGAALAVVHGGAVIHQTTVGLARLPDGPPVTPATAFRLASITKQLTAHALALLVDEGRVSLDMPVRAVIPSLPEWADPILVGHLVVHTSGLPDYEDMLPSGGPQVGDRDVVELLSQTSAAAFTPGSRFRYSNTGYVILGVLIEEVAGRAFGRVLEERIFRPLAMHDTVAHVEGETTVSERAIGYRPEGGAFVDADQGPTTATLGDGGVYSSIRDLARWDAALREPGFQPDPASLAPFAARAGGVGGTPGPYGFGWFLDTFRGRHRQRHEGWSTGFQNEIQRFPATGLTVILLTNRASPPVRPVVEAVVEVIGEAIGGSFDGGPT